MLLTSVLECSATASDAGAAGCVVAAGGFGAAGCFGAAVAFGAVGRFGAAVAFGAVGRFGAAVTFGVVGRLRAAVAFGAAAGNVAELGRRDATRDCNDFGALERDALGFDGLCFDSVGRGALARTFVLAALREAAGLRARACSAARAALAFFFACLAAFLLAFANFRARLSTFLAARTCCFAASARAAAVVASVFSRCAATALFVRVSVD
jgi:hypothetical protein